MSYTFNLDSTDAMEKAIADVRDEIDDQTSVANPTEGTDYFLTDERIQKRLTKATRAGRTEENVANMAAVSALDTLATNQAYVLKVGSTLGESRNGASVVDSIRKHADSLRALVKTDELPIADEPGRMRVKRRSNNAVPLRPTY